ncbi:MBL fold metallo-hydrolase [Sabulicella glaciei]|uniref:MBL fold metallo-hydrolase n=1 Tax=Sabulicella glaciei TaxID=2984948 RepID=A0ABT3P0D6_9PROT|nr:MBL fold metallo-hydrolase [Roseococcus sp. MDT2-1-1]MCW8087638.1 MBL fold metallo-hydrolase [Roseococcus sp. MDT2-1-1]
MSTHRRGLFAGSAAIATAMALPAAAQNAPAAAAPPAQAQAPGFYRFKVGNLTVTTVHDGFFRRPVEGFVRNAPVAEVQEVLRDSFMPTDTLTVPFTLTFVETPRGLVVFDAGTGGQMAPTAGQMGANLRAAGLDPAQVRAVVVSHFHGDHITGLTTAQNEPAFPQAEIFVPAAEWAWWTDEGNRSRSPEGQRGTFENTARRFAPYRDRIRQVQDRAEVLPGIRAIAAHGHTPGHTCYHVSDGDAQMIFLADITNRPEIMMPRPDWQIVFDFDPEAAAQSRRRMLDRVATDRIRVTGYHFPFPANGHVARQGQGFRFVAADWTTAL